MPKLIRRLLDRPITSQFLDALTHSGPSYNPPPLPRRGDAVEAWLKAQRDEFSEQHDTQWDVIDHLLGTYRLHADTRTPLHEHVCPPGPDDDCAGCYDAREARRG
jgi:hypothetical protein